MYQLNPPVGSSFHGTNPRRSPAAGNQIAPRPQHRRCPHHLLSQHGAPQALPAPGHPSSSSSSSSRLRRAAAVQAQPGPDKGSVAALEAAVGAINNILGTYNKVRGAGTAGQKPGSSGSSAAARAGGAAGAGALAGPSKLISFSAKASGSVPVKVS